MKDNLKNIDPAKFLIGTNIELATRFTPQLKQFIQELSSANGRAVLFHCASGKDRTGYAAAIILRILGVPQKVVMDDYLLSNEYYLSAYLWNFFVLRLMKGKRVSTVAKGFSKCNLLIFLPRLRPLTVSSVLSKSMSAMDWV